VTFLSDLGKKGNVVKKRNKKNNNKKKQKREYERKKPKLPHGGSSHREGVIELMITCVQKVSL
jgi:hypothetical protein